MKRGRVQPEQNSRAERNPGRGFARGLATLVLVGLVACDGEQPSGSSEQPDEQGGAQHGTPDDARVPLGDDGSASEAPDDSVAANGEAGDGSPLAMADPGAGASGEGAPNPDDTNDTGSNVDPGGPGSTPVDADPPAMGTEPGDPGDSPLPSNQAAQACAPTEVDVSLLGKTLVLLFDVSSSWGSELQPYWRRDLKWDPMVAATKAFFTDPESSGLSATLTFYPNELASTVGGTQGAPGGFGGDGADGGPTPGGFLVNSEACQAEGYREPDVPLSALPTDSFAAAIDAITPETENDWRLGSPLAAALEGSFALADALQSERPEDEVVVLMITDGYPALCGEMPDGDLGPTLDVITSRDTVPLYVIGVRDPVTEEEPNPPDEATALHELTRATGTGDATLIDTGDPAATEQAIALALREMTGARTCEVRIPLELDPNAVESQGVNVTLHLDETATPLPYDANCGDDLGWRYDDAASPTRIELCDGACAAAVGARLTMNLACAN